MKKRMISLSAVVALVVLTAMVIGCERTILPENTESGDLNGNLRVKVFEIEKTPFGSLSGIGGFSSTRDEQDVSEVCTRLNFAIYDESGARVKQVNQLSTDKAFGTASFQLDEGNYLLVVVGHSSNGNPTTTNPQKIQFTNTQGYTDTFLANGEVTIGEEVIELNVSLDRIVALCRFVITDEIPADVKKMKFYYTGGSGAFSAYTGLGTVNSKQEVTFDVTSGKKQFDLYTFLHEPSDNIALKVSGLDVNGNILYERDFDVPMEQNHITWLSGAFFDGSVSSSTTVTGVTVDTDWAGETHMTF